MKREVKRFLICFSCIAILSIFAVPKTMVAIGNTAGKPGITIIKTVHGCKRFEHQQIHPNRYILSKGTTRPWAPVIYDIQTNRKINLPAIENLSGIEKPINIQNLPRANRRYIINGLKLEGKYWRWNDKKIVHYNPETGTIGLYLAQNKTVKTVSGNPPCIDGSVSRFISQYNMYYCARNRKYVNKKNYLKQVNNSYYAEMDLKSKKLNWMTPLERNWNHPMEQKGVLPIGVDPSGSYFYYFNRIYFLNKKKTPGHIILHRFNIKKRKVDWKHTIKVPVRYKGRTASTYSISSFTSSDFSHIVFLEYDEGPHNNPAKGSLFGPKAQGYVVNTETRSHISLSIPVTSYGRLIDRKKKYLFLGSNQLATIFRYDLATGKLTNKVRSGRNIFKLIESPNSKYVYVFHKTGVDAFALDTMKKIKTIPLHKIFPGITTLLVSESMYVSNDGKHAAMGILKKKRNGPWASSDMNDGFHLLKIED